MHFAKRLTGVAFFATLSFGAGECVYPGQNTAALQVRSGFLEFLDPVVFQPFREAIPHVEDAPTDAILRSPDAIWYDEQSMVFYYQDSIEPIVGGRANCVGRSIGEKPPLPVVGKLKNFFGPDFRFAFPFRTVAGTDNVSNIRTYNFWYPPRKNGEVLPVKYWRPTKRGRWYWTFPIGTVIGEVLYEKGFNDKWYVFEIRTRRRYREGWAVDLFRPFTTAQNLARAVKRMRPDWMIYDKLSDFVDYLENKETLIKNRWDAKFFTKVFPALEGALDPLPDPGDRRLIVELLTKTTFVSAQGSIWKENAGLQSYAPGSQTDFNIVPKGFEGGMIPVNEVSCNRCHADTGRKMAEFDSDIQLYGEVWGEDRIFTWHPFEPHEKIYGTYDDTDSSRTINSRLVRANLVREERPASGDADYKALPSAFNE